MSTMRVCTVCMWVRMHVCFVYFLPMSLGRAEHSAPCLGCVRAHECRHAHTNTHTHTHTRSSALIWCDRAVILAVLTLWASICLPLSPSYPFGSRSQSGVHQPLPPATSVCLHVCVRVCVSVFAILPCSFSQG